MSQGHTIPVETNIQLATNNAAPKSKCLRISGIPDGWSVDTLRQCLQTLDPNLCDDEFKISLYPACHGSGQVGMLNLSHCTEYFKRVVPYKPFFACAQDQDLSIDCDFNGLTPLNTPPKDILADVVAVTGLAGHPYGSWKSHQSHRMWLQDFLPRDLSGVRIMTFGYDSRIEANKGTSRMLDYARFFVDQLYIARSSKSVWLIRILLMISSHFYSAGTISSYYIYWPLARWYLNYPGLRTEELEEMARDLIPDSEDTIDLLRKLRAGSEFLESQSEDIAEILDKMKSSQTGKYERSGEEVQAVAPFAAFVNLRHEIQIPVPANHTDIVKFLSNSDPTYISLVTHLKDCVPSSSPEHKEHNEEIPVVNEVTVRPKKSEPTSLPDTDTIVAMSNLASTLHDRGQLEEAEKVQRKVLELRIEILGPQHPDTILTMGDLATTIYGRGQLEEAEKIQRK
ncbi:16380_t:CDS:2, partial [Acaulospora colombiana]